MIDENEEHLVDWRTDVRRRIPDWSTDEALKRWPTVKKQLHIGQGISGEVIARAPFGVWLDIGVTFPALLIVPNMEGAKVRRIAFDDYPSKGTFLDGRINVLGNAGEIGVTQNNPDRKIEGEDTT